MHSLVSEPDPRKSEGGSGRQAGVEVYRVECMEFVINSSTYFTSATFSHLWA